jgi:hypothetical protein
MKNKAAQQLGKLGGKSTAKKHGKKHFSNAGKKGMAIRWYKATLDIEKLIPPGDRLADGAEVTMPDGKIYIYKLGKLKKL